MCDKQVCPESKLVKLGPCLFKSSEVFSRDMWRFRSVDLWRGKVNAIRHSLVIPSNETSRACTLLRSATQTNTANTKTRKGSEDVWRKQRSVTQMLVLVGSALQAAPEWLRRWMPDWRPRSRRAAEKFLALGPLGPLGPPEKFGAYRAEDFRQGDARGPTGAQPNESKRYLMHSNTDLLLHCFIYKDSLWFVCSPETSFDHWWWLMVGCFKTFTVNAFAVSPHLPSKSVQDSH